MKKYKKYAISVLALLLVVWLPASSIASGLAVRSPWKKVGPNVTLAIPLDRVGIGLETPNNRLQVAGLINFNDALRGTFLGFEAGMSVTGLSFNNTYIGHQAGRHDHSGYANVFMGTNAGFSNATGFDNTFIGADAGFSNTTGQVNTFIGAGAGFQSGGSFNTFLGSRAGSENRRGFSNTFIGESAGRLLADGFSLNVNSNESIFIGNNTRASAANNVNEIVIGINTTGIGSNSITLGNMSVTRTMIRGNLVGGTRVIPLPTPGAPTVAPQATGGTTTWGYRVTARNIIGETLASTEGRTTFGNATLTVVNHNFISWPVVPGAIDYRIYRTTAGGTPATTGLIGTTTGLNFNDSGLAATTPVPIVDSSSNFAIGTATPAAGNKLEVHDGHIVNTMTTPPGVTCNVGTPTIIGTDMGGGITVPAGASSCTITFTIPWNQIYGCVVSSSVSGAHPFVPALSNTSATFNFTATPAAVTSLYYHCSGR